MAHRKIQYRRMRDSEKLTLPFEAFEAKLAADDDRDFWKTALAVLAQEFLQRHEEEASKGDWAMVVGACSHWRRPHQSRWTLSGGFAWPAGYEQFFPKLEWSVILIYRDGQLLPAAKLPGKKVNLFQVAVPTRTLRHKQAAVHTRWSTGSKSVLFGVRSLDEKWKCVAVSDAESRGPVSRVTFETTISNFARTTRAEPQGSNHSSWRLLGTWPTR